MLIDYFDFDLPKQLIANFPVEPRDYARMLVYERQSDQLEFGHFFDLPKYLGKNDVLVFNNSKVIPARLIFERQGKKVEVFILGKENGLWQALVRPGRKFNLGDEVKIEEIVFKVEKIDQEGLRYFSTDARDEEISILLERSGEMPVPPYIEGKQFRNDDYQNVYSTKKGSVAAPTAGLHFTNELISRLEAKGVKIEYVTLHVGLGTFLPVKSKDSRWHKMHEEKYEIDYRTAEKLNQYKSQKKRIIAVGTTTVRVLEDNYNKYGKILPGQYSTNIFIKPGYEWTMVNGLVTNFHLPKSTLLMLVSALIGREKLLELYQKAIARRMRFFSFGDGMIIL